MVWSCPSCGYTNNPDTATSCINPNCNAPRPSSNAPSPNANWSNWIIPIIGIIVFIMLFILINRSSVASSLGYAGNIFSVIISLLFVGLVVVLLRALGLGRIMSRPFRVGYNAVKPGLIQKGSLSLFIILVVVISVLILSGSLGLLGFGGSLFYTFLIGGILLIVLWFFLRKSKSKFWNYDLSNISSFIKKNLSFKNIIILFLIILIFLFLIRYGIGAKLFSAPLTWIYGVLAVVLFSLGIYFFSKENKGAGWFFIILSVLLIILVFSPLEILRVLPYNQLRTWLLIGSLLLAFIVLFNKKTRWLVIPLLLIAVGIWFFYTEGGSAFLQTIGVKAQVAGGETFSARLSKYWGYIKNPEDFFSRYGEFGNPNVENRALVGLKIEKFEPLIKEFRTNQDLRFSGEVKHYSLPVFKQGESGAKESSELNIGFSCYIPKNMQDIQANLTPYFADKIEVKPGKTEDVDTNGHKEAILKEPLKFKNFTKFVICTFNQGNVVAIKEKETRQAYLNVSYKDFVTRSDIYAYLLGNDAYQKIEDGVLQAGGDLDTEFLYQLRSAASYPGLIDNERRTISEFSSGPVWLQVNILDQQPLKSKGSEQYTLRVKSMPNSVDWIGSINVKNIYLVVPSWFNPVAGACDFSDAGASVQDTQGGDPKARLSYDYSITNSGVKRLLLNKQIFNEGITGCAGGGRGCSFFCSFTVNSEKNEQNIQEYRISAYQTTDYSITQGTTFDLIKSRTTGVINENENARQNPSGFMNGLVINGKKEDLERYLNICINKKDRILSSETINNYILSDVNNCNRVSEVQDKLNKLNMPATSDNVKVGNGGEVHYENIIRRPIGDLVIQDSTVEIRVETIKSAQCKFDEDAKSDFDTMRNTFSTTNGFIHIHTFSNVNPGKYFYLFGCKSSDGALDYDVIYFTET